MSDNCQCWNEGEWGRVHREDCPIHAVSPRSGVEAGGKKELGDRQKPVVAEAGDWAAIKKALDTALTRTTFGPHENECRDVHDALDAYRRLASSTQPEGERREKDLGDGQRPSSARVAQVWVCDQCGDEDIRLDGHGCFFDGDTRFSASATLVSTTTPEASPRLSDEVGDRIGEGALAQLRNADRSGSLLDTATQDGSHE